MIIKIDTRETELLKKCQDLVLNNQKFKNIKLISETLPLGDIIVNDGENDCIIVERKTLSDLAASIKDGRYEEQSYRLNGLNHHNHNIIYLIEGEMNRFNSFKDRIDKQTLYSAMISINYFKGFSVLRSSNLDETAQLCCTMVYKLVSNLKANKFGYYSNVKNTNTNTNTNANTNIIQTEEQLQQNNEQKEEQLQQNKEQPEEQLQQQQNNEVSEDKDKEKDYCSVIKKVKKENITTSNIGEIMLCQIPGISSTSALAILQHFKTLPNLIKCIQEDDKCLNTICTTDAKGKSRKISKTAIATIIEYLKN
jgi:ERCC4-type nuclease